MVGTKNMRLSVLFIGNSYTYFHELWDHFSAAARAGGYEVEVDHVTKGGWTLEKMASTDDEYGKQAHEKLTDRTKRYDIVFLQEQSERPASDPALFYDGVRVLNQKIVAAGAKTVLYQTWGRKTGAESLAKHGWTNESMTKLLAGAYEAIAHECGLALSPAGTAFYDVYTHHPEIELYTEDGSHPSDIGTYLVALCHFATVYQISPVGLSYTGPVKDAETLRVLQRAAHDAVFGPSILSDSERPCSIGITAKNEPQA